jgi:hypothetical protein
VQFLLYAPGLQLPIVAAFSSLVLLDHLGVLRARFVLPLTVVGLWAVCLAWFWEPPLWTNVATVLSVGLTLTILALTLSKSRTSVSSPRRRLTLNLLVAAILTFAFPIILWAIACTPDGCG